MQAKIKKVELRNLQIEDYKELKKSMIMSYPELEDSYWKEEDIEKILSLFPDGQLVILADKKVVGAAFSLIVDEILVDKNPDACTRCAPLMCVQSKVPHPKPTPC